VTQLLNRMGATSRLKVGTFLPTVRLDAYWPSAEATASAPAQSTDAASRQVDERIEVVIPLLDALSSPEFQGCGEGVL
jgi:hypothetical protein